MGLETTASLSTIAGFHVDWPESTDPFSECDDHAINLKRTTTGAAQADLQIRGGKNRRGERCRFPAESRLCHDGLPSRAVTTYLRNALAPDVVVNVDADAPRFQLAS